MRARVISDERATCGDLIERNLGFQKPYRRPRESPMVDLGVQRRAAWCPFGLRQLTVKFVEMAQIEKDIPRAVGRPDRPSMKAEIAFYQTSADGALIRDHPGAHGGRKSG